MNRFELKYKIQGKHLDLVRSYLSSIGKFEKQYHVLSTYFDDWKKTAYQAKLDGDYERKKIRIRSYSKNFSEGKDLFLEKKIRKGQLISKERVQIDKHFLTEALAGKCNHPWLVGLNPKLTIYYFREEYVFSWGRITVDSDITIKWDHFEKKLNDSILEIKTESPFDSSQFKWLHQISKVQSFSKYATGMSIKEGHHAE